MCIRSRSSISSMLRPNNIESRIPMTSSGLRTLESNGDKKMDILLSMSLILSSLIRMSSLVQKRDFVSLLLLIDATSRFLKLWVCFMVEPQLVQQELERQKLSRILDVLLVFSSLSPTAQMSTSSETWPRSSRVFANLVFGVASMSSTESLSQPSLWLPLRLSQLPKPKSKMCQDSCSQMRKSQFCLSKPVPTSSR